MPLGIMYKIILMIVIIVIALYLFRTSFDVAKTKAQEEDNIRLVDDNLATLMNKIRICSSDRTIRLENVGFSYEKDSKFVPVIFFKGMAFSAKVTGQQDQQSQDYIKFPIKGGTPTIQATIPTIREEPENACQEAGGECGYCAGQSNEIIEFKSVCSFPPTYSRTCCVSGPRPEIPLDSLLASNDDTFLLGFMAVDSKCKSLVDEGMRIKDFSDTCAGLIRSTFFMVGRVDCGQPPAVRHSECINNACVLVDGPGTNQCLRNENCQSFIRPTYACQGTVGLCDPYRTYNSLQDCESASGQLACLPSIGESCAPISDCRILSIPQLPQPQLPSSPQLWSCFRLITGDCLLDPLTGNLRTYSTLGACQISGECAGQFFECRLASQCPGVRPP